ncbi:MAG: sialate O-acetylesterase [Firmicutes bacterium]|nr:sialate O-acetylesterase [Bacillota bacterium]
MKINTKRVFLLLMIVFMTLSPILLIVFQNAVAIRVACVGDSITYGAKIEDKFLNSYPAQLQQLLGGKYLVKNFGASGYSLQKNTNFPYWNHPNFQKSSDFQPNVVFLMLGTNDTKPYNWTGTENFLSDLEDLVIHYQTLDSHPEIYLMTPATVFSGHFKLKDNYKMQENVADIISNAILSFGKEHNLPVIDIHEATRTHPEYFLLDGVHPDSAGASAIAQEVYQTFCKQH